MNNGAYLLARFSGKEHLLPALEALGQIDGVDGWDAVEGHCDLVIKVASSGAESLKQVRTLGGLADLKVCEIVDEADSAGSIDPEFCRAYAFLEVDPDQAEKIRSELSRIGEIATVIRTKGDCDMIALVVGENFGLIDRIVIDKIRPIDGLLRMKQNRIIDLDNL